MKHIIAAVSTLTLASATNHETVTAEGTSAMATDLAAALKKRVMKEGVSIDPPSTAPSSPASALLNKP